MYNNLLSGQSRIFQILKVFVSMTMESLLRKAKPEVAAALRDILKCTHSENEQLTRILNELLSASNDIDDTEIIDCLKYLIAGGSTPEEFSSTVRLYDRATTCGLVWTENFVAYRCRTCGISPCMSLCTECFHQGNHEGHDFIVFRSKTSGACDCGEINIIKESGCCSLHGPQGTHQTPSSRNSKSSSDSPSTSFNEQSAPPELLCIANGMMPYLFLRLILSMREESRMKILNPIISTTKMLTCKHTHNNNNETTSNLSKGHEFIKMLQGFSDMGVAMKQVMIHALTQPHAYHSLLLLDKRNDNQKVSPEFKTFLEELVYWIVRFEFPDDLICLMLSMRSDSSYKEVFTKAFIKHYQLISETILKSADPEKLCKHAVAVSVQLFSIERLATRMVEEERLLYLLVSTLDNMIETAMKPYSEKVIKERGLQCKRYLDCEHDIMKNNYYWPIKSDLRQLLSYQQVAFKFFEDEQLVEYWFEFLSRFQGMNLIRYIEKGHPHIEQETDAHIGTVTAEIELSATPLWTLLAHLKDQSTATFTQRAINLCWRKLVGWNNSNTFHQDEISFHLPLHRNLSMFIHQGMQHQQLKLFEMLPFTEKDKLQSVARQLIRLQSTFHQIIGHFWSRNGSDVMNQAHSYVNSLCCNSMIDADIFLLQTISSCIPRKDFLQCVFEEFRIYEILKHTTIRKEKEIEINSILESEEENTMIESCLLFLSTLTTSRTNLGMSDEHLMALEMSTLLCQGDKLHSELMELLPERCGSDSQLKNFETVLSQVADYHAPKNMQQGIYLPKAIVWQQLYDPIHTLLRTSNRSEFQISLDRFQEYVKRSKVFSTSTILWPPFRIPQEATDPYSDPRNLLSSNLVLEVLFIILFKIVHLKSIPNFTVSLTVYLLELAVSFKSNKTNCQENLASFFKGNDFVSNLIQEVDVSSWKEGTHDMQIPKSESIVSLLLMLHTQLKGIPNSYTPHQLNSEDIETENEIMENRIGDGSFFVGILLDKINSLDSSLREYILKELKASAVNNCDVNNEKEKEDTRRKAMAEKRKLQIMTEFAMKRQQFLNEADEVIETDESPVEVKSETIDYECVFCLEKGESKPENPFGLITFLTPSNTSSHRKFKKEFNFSNFETLTFKNIWSTTIPEFHKCFDEASVRLSIPIDLGIGVCIQTCGHYLHTDCFNSYINSLRKSRSFLAQRESIQLSSKRFQCPMCRSFGNSFLPCIKDSLGMISDLQNNNSDEDDANELRKLFKKRNTLVLSPKQKLGVEKFLQDLNKCVSFVTCDQNKECTSTSGSAIISPQAISSVFLNSLEMELLRIKSTADASRSCISSLYSAFRYSYKSLSIGHSRKLATIWEIICGSRVSKRQKEVPVLLQDVNLLLVHFVLQLPYGTENKYFNVVVQNLCHLQMVQIIAALCSSLDPEYISQLKQITNCQDSDDAISYTISCILNYFENMQQSYKNEEDERTWSSSFGSIAPSLLRNQTELKCFVQERIISFLRKAALLKRFICKNNENENNIFEYPQSLGELLDSADPSDSKSGSFFFGDNSTRVLQWISLKVLEKVIPTWMEELIQGNLCAKELFLPHLINWEEPRLIEMTLEYDHIFETYRKLTCPNCNAIPSEPALCLTCKKIVCLNSFCCLDKQSKMSEVIHHSLECGMGSSVFLCILSSAVLVVAGQDACVWGSIFLDSFGEEDLDLQRGKPLFLCKERFQFLQRQWSTNSFLKSELKWFPHDNML